MEQVCVERLDHLGLIASVIKDLGLIGMIDRRLVPDAQERMASIRGSATLCFARWTQRRGR
jgi:hypothetical protein